MIYYRSDWPEVGLPTALVKSRQLCPSDHFDIGHDWVQEARVSGLTMRWIGEQNKFESNLYGLSIWDLHLELEDVDDKLLTDRFDNTLLQEIINDGASKLADASPWGAAYVSSKLVKNEPLYNALLHVGFEEVECRSIYLSKVRNIITRPASFENGIRATSLSAVAPEKLFFYHEKILNLCREAFTKLFGRHFTDGVLLERLPGIAYILAAMELNFKTVPPENFLVAVNDDTDQLCGFSAVGRKPGLGIGVYTQLLSAVANMHRGQGVYNSLTRLMSQTLPQDVSLLNVTHIGNQAMQRAYLDSGRDHLADTVVLRRVFNADR